MVYIHRVTLALSSKRRLEIISLLGIPNSQRRISVKNLERIIVNIRSMHLTVPGTIGHFYKI